MTGNSKPTPQGIGLMQARPFDELWGVAITPSDDLAPWFMETCGCGDGEVCERCVRQGGVPDVHASHVIDLFLEAANDTASFGELTADFRRYQWWLALHTIFNAGRVHE